MNFTLQQSKPLPWKDSNRSDGFNQTNWKDSISILCPFSDLSLGTSSTGAVLFKRLWWAITIKLVFSTLGCGRKADPEWHVESFVEIRKKSVNKIRWPLSLGQTFFSCLPKYNRFLLPLLAWLLTAVPLLLPFKVCFHVFHIEPKSNNSSNYPNLGWKEGKEAQQTFPHFALKWEIWPFTFLYFGFKHITHEAKTPKIGSIT